MKRIFFLFALLYAISINAQNNTVDISLQQDLRLLTVGDDRGNDPVTANILSRLEVPLYNFQKSHIAAHASFEYADLIDKNYTRYALGGGYIIDNFSGKFGIAAYFDYGKIYRETVNFNSFSLSGELNFKVSNRLKIICTQQLTHRKDLKELYGSREYVISGFVGLKYAI